MKANLIRLLADNRSVRGRAARIEQTAQSSEATIYLYDTIVGAEWEAEWFGGVTSQQLVPQIDQLKADVIHLRINSPGGDVFAAQAIGAALKRHKAQVIAHVDGLAASAATAIAMACDQVLIDAGAMFMIHNAWTIAMGDKNDFMETAALLEKVDGALRDQYAAKSGKSAADVASLMDAETWFTGQEAVDAGFADALDGDSEDAGEDDGDEAAEKKAAAMWNLAAFEKAPKKPAAAAPAPEAPTPADYERRARLKILTARAA